MSRSHFVAAATVVIAVFVSTDVVRAERWSISSNDLPTPVSLVSRHDVQDQPSYEELQGQFEETKARLEQALRQLDAAVETAERYGTPEELEEFREAIGWDLDSQDLREFNHEPAGGGDTPGPGGEMGDMATQSQNPVGGLWMMWLQNDMHLYEGPGDGKRIFNTTVFQPVMPVQLNERWKLINRPVFLFHEFETPGNFEFNPGGSFPPVQPPSDPFSTQAGLGDIGLIQWLSNSPASSKMVTGFGWNWMFPAATFPDLGTGRTSFGPSFVAMYLGEKIIAGGIMQQYWSIDNRQDRTRVSYMDLQYVFRYRLNPMFGIGFAPNVKWDQVTGKVTMPVGFGFDTMTMAFGKMPMRWGAELQYFASHESPSRQFDPEWNFRLYVSPIIKAPEWATRGLLGGGSCRRCR
jgi:hypothetical protein